ncbi:hypothetical protein ACHAW5_005399 [Stephanodiscus triporus]|uniref:Peptidase M11 gametolysin domain-containing protein n=1 Tax=Stephanodiscus triporus TaxID=2934178 RepID=A0ABD3QAJ8_9STRA
MFCSLPRTFCLVSADESRAERDLQAQRPDRQAFSIGLSDGRVYEVENAPPGWEHALVSGHDKVVIPEGAVIHSNGKIDVKGKNLSKMTDMNNGPPGDVVVRTPGQERNLAALRSSRMLQAGTKTVLAVRIIVNDGAYSWADQTGLSNDVFGNGVDSVNLKSQYTACSYNQLIFEKAPDKSMLTTITPNAGDTNIINGVVDIKVNHNKTAGDGTIVNAVTTELNRVFGVTSPTALANHVMYCLPSGVMSGIAYAYISSWNSVYSNEWCNYVSTQMHEIGHNLGFAHSNELGPYKDQTGMMGYSYSQDDGPVMCFNGAKSWQTGWLPTKSKVINPGEFFESNLHGIADYNNAASSYVLFKINDSSATDIYVAYNRKKGINSGTVEAGDQVTITQAGGEGTSYAESELLAKLSAGGMWTGTVSGRSVTVHVKSILTIDSAQVSHEYSHEHSLEGSHDGSHDGSHEDSNSKSNHEGSHDGSHEDSNSKSNHEGSHECSHEDSHNVSHDEEAHHLRLSWGRL